MYIDQTGRSLKQHVSEHRRALKNGDVQTSALAEHVFKTGHAVDLSQSEVLDHHQHTTTRCMLKKLVHPAQPGSLEQGARNATGSVRGAPGLMGMYPLSPCFLSFPLSYSTLVL